MIQKSQGYSFVTLNMACFTICVFEHRILLKSLTSVSLEHIIKGLNDSEGRDTEHIAKIIAKLKIGKVINAFVIVRNGAEQRMSKAYSDMLRIFELSFGVNFAMIFI